jgi:hypothetical protein
MPNPTLMRRVTGNTYPNIAAQFRASSAQLASIADTASLSGGAGLDMSWVAWVNFDLLGTSRNIFSKYVSTQREYLMWYQSPVGFRMEVSAAGVSASAAATATNFGVPAVGAWNFVAAVYNGTTLAISVNAGTANSGAYSSDIFNGTGRFALGSTDGTLSHMDGRLDCVGVFCSARGAGGALSTDDIAALYRNGVGSAYRDVPGNIKPYVVGWWDLDGNLNDASGNGNHLADTNGITYGSGKR